MIDILLEIKKERHYENTLKKFRKNNDNLNLFTDIIEGLKSDGIIKQFNNGQLFLTESGEDLIKDRS